MVPPIPERPHAGLDFAFNSSDKIRRLHGRSKDLMQWSCKQMYPKRVRAVTIV